MKILQVALMAALVVSAQAKAPRVKVTGGTIEGSLSADGQVKEFKGIPYAAAPEGQLRWKAPQPVAPWKGARSATEFGARCMQGQIYADMVFRDSGPSENCLYLNVWAPAQAKKLPVMVWIYGGGLNAGAASEPRQDGGNLARQSVILVSMNYRLGVFGFFAHADLAKESGHDSAGNFGLLDQVAALEWVQKNIAAFGGDAGNVTIFGQSAGASSVSALVASPLAKGLFQKAIGESGGALNPTRPVPALAETEATDLEFAKNGLGTASLAELRNKPAVEVLEAALKAKDLRFGLTVDGYFLPENPVQIYAAGKQSHVPLMAGFTADEGSAKAIFGDAAQTAANLDTELRKIFPDRADEAVKLFGVTNDAQAARAALELNRDRGVGATIWRWLEFQRTTGGMPTWRFEFDRARALPKGSTGDLTPRAYHSAEIEFVFSVLPEGFSEQDVALEKLMSGYWTNFAKTGNPNGAGLLEWPVYDSEKGAAVMHFDSVSKVAADHEGERFRFLNGKH